MKLVSCLIIMVIFCLSNTISLQTMTQNRMETLRRNPDYNHHFIFFHKQTFQQLESSLERWAKDKDVLFYMNDCKSNKLAECDNPASTPFILLFNRILIKYNGDFSNHKEVLNWVESRIVSSPTYVHTMPQLQQLLSSKRDIFCFCSDSRRADDQALFYALSKSLPFLNYCVMNNPQVYKQLGLKLGNFTYFLNSTTNRRQFQHRNQYQHWQWFVKNNMIPQISRVQDIVSQRFKHQNKSIQVVGLVCDLAYRCQDTWSKAHELQEELSTQKLGYDLKLVIQDGKGIFSFNLYYHFTFNMPDLPALVHISLHSDGTGSGNYTRHVKYLKQQLSIDAIHRFRDEVKSGQIEPMFLTAQPPKNNGFIGKGADRLIQKLVASNFMEIIEASQNHYVLLLTAFKVGCKQCQEFYSQYKQIASLLSETDITFGVMNTNQNEVTLQAIGQLPDILLFKKDDKQNPIRMQVAHSFDHLMLFLKMQLGDKYANTDQL